MARITHAAQIDLRFGNSACENFDVSAGVPPRDLTCESLHFFKKRWVRLDGKAQTMAERIFCRAGTTVIGFRPGANLSIHAVGFNLAVARQAAFFPLAGVASITLNSRVLGLLHAPAQCFTEDRPTPIDLVQTGITAALGDSGQAIDPLDIVEFLGRSASTVRVSMLTLAVARSLWINLTAPGSRRTYSCASSSAL